MNLFNFGSIKNKSFSTLKKAEFNSINNNQKKVFPTIEETAEAISSCFTPEQLKKLEISNDDKTFSFKEQLIAEFYYYTPISDVEYIKNKIKDDIQKNEKIFEFATNDKINLFFSSICSFFFLKD